MNKYIKKFRERYTLARIIIIILTAIFLSAAIIKVSDIKNTVKNNRHSYVEIVGKSDINKEDFPRVRKAIRQNYKTKKPVEVIISDIQYAELDNLGRTRKAKAVITYDMIMLSKGWREKWEKGSEPSGWFSPNGKSNNKKVEISLDDGRVYKGYFYNRSHLIADSLGGRAFRRNVITGTRTQNVGNNDKNSGMQYLEQKILNYILNNKDIVVYYVADPIYLDDELLPRYVEVSALSSDGKIDEKVLVENSAKGYKINYKTGKFNKI